MTLTPVFAVEMEKDCDCYIVTKDINNETVFSNVFQESLELVVKQIGITNEATKMVENLRQSILKITLSLKNIVKEHFAIFRRVEAWFLEMQKTGGENFKLQETLDYFIKEFPNGTRRLYESLNFLFLSVMGRFTRKPYNEKIINDPFYQSFQRMTLDILHEWTLFETTISSAWSFEMIKNNLRRGPISMENEHLDIHFLRTLGGQEAEKYKETLKRIIDALQNHGKENRVVRPKRIFSQESVDQINTSRITFQKRCQESVSMLDSRIMKKKQSLPKEQRKKLGIGRVYEASFLKALAKSQKSL
ncbi:Oidioi.mRNA.OKI2018_I69.chr2.g5905.t1.cds [Oikopleura dioica]|uniref:Oidioi.mRNA.OKI2018_I69.chr2.g5905.t1.cds n=1 Tax=Oikopleura dioica TaxID=34765 RepID=A0ABN7T8D0_OIKDI|nr:Oidioi.mRNA.OKI2018_I69.chr2.g5905.t1.cds [Oikopleura dioica]